MPNLSVNQDRNRNMALEADRFETFFALRTFGIDFDNPNFFSTAG